MADKGMKFDFSLDPFDQFERHYQNAVQTKELEPNAMALATVSDQSKPTNRIVYYKGIIRGGFSFYTNYRGRKARDIEKNPNVCANFFWPSLHEQIRIEGKALRLTRGESETYFRTRARESQIGAWASQQSDEVASYEELLAKYAESEIKFHGKEVPCPPNWGGFHIIPEVIEFWHGKNARLHERYIYEKTANGWKTLMRFP